MDAHYITYASTSLRDSSKIYQDLRSTRLYSIVGAQKTRLLGSLAMDSLEKQKFSDLDGQPHIGIVGAGLAGLRCADILCRYGFRVTIVEGRDRIGGRMVQERLPNGHLVDLGPNWIHGTSENPMLDLAKQTNTAVGSWDTRTSMFDESGKLFHLNDSENYSEIMWDIVQDAFRHSNKHWTTIPAEESLWDFFQKKVVERIPETEADFERKRNTVLQVSELWGAFVGSPITRQSLKFFWLEECIEGENLFCADTYHKILETIARPAKEHATIMYNTRVERVELRTQDRPHPRIRTSGGAILEFDEVILTAPLGWLKRNLAAFDPSLPERLQQGINSIGYGCLEKVYISFPKAFWLVPDSEGRVVQGFCQWLAPRYAPETNPRKWNQEIVELASSGLATSHPTLLFYIYGEESQFITEELGKMQTEEQRDGFLYSFFKPYYSRLPQYDEASPDCQPTGCLATDWLHDDLAGNGSYSNFQVGLEQGDKDIRTMRDGVPEGGLWLAGEHTAPFVALGTATGAYWSGESVGRRIAEAYGREMETDKS
ncbi:FAD/NAD(P)-binding domain-containing protein [Sodiomyces alkalinus F11]|uniref:FAD/NAD(P)-binding domain-containing protein n=1 Tax=Sodiomyces alkalinus (strain CBS 110278 / VKM F-3762 / F11) TaxID=1314773 RepID=A0A3N2Q401_SODAK|nr:FAD/NAD(P)-binding domain-containing protein [Sodiomyces alkalinus F11]ROT41480.1 FAD/NAD(P)-binding domain-containing protein [Sodiomyces alkalinus F11]